MTDADLWAAWRIWMVVAVVIVLVAAALLVTIWLTARSIAAHARRAVDALEAIRGNPRAIWGLQTTNEVAMQNRAEAEAQDTCSIPVSPLRASASDHPAARDR